MTEKGSDIQGKKEMAWLSEIFSVLSDEDTLRIVTAVAEGHELKISDFETPKRYYSRLSKLKSSSILKKLGNSYQLTAFGSIIYGIIHKVMLTHDFYWKLQVVDALSDKIPSEERQSIIESLVPDQSIRDTLTELNVTKRTLEKVQRIVRSQAE
jgi:hypothetical protein